MIINCDVIMDTNCDSSDEKIIPIVDGETLNNNAICDSVENKSCGSGNLVQEMEEKESSGDSESNIALNGEGNSSESMCDSLSEKVLEIDSLNCANNTLQENSATDGSSVLSASCSTDSNVSMDSNCKSQLADHEGSVSILSVDDSVRLTVSSDTDTNCNSQSNNEVSSTTSSGFSSQSNSEVTSPNSSGSNENGAVPESQSGPDITAEPGAMSDIVGTAEQQCHDDNDLETEIVAKMAEIGCKVDSETMEPAPLVVNKESEICDIGNNNGNCTKVSCNVSNSEKICVQKVNLVSVNNSTSVSQSNDTESVPNPPGEPPGDNETESSKLCDYFIKNVNASCIKDKEINETGNDSTNQDSEPSESSHLNLDEVKQTEDIEVEEGKFVAGQPNVCLNQNSAPGDSPHINLDKEKQSADIEQDKFIADQPNVCLNQESTPDESRHINSDGVRIIEEDKIIEGQPNVCSNQGTLECSDSVSDVSVEVDVTHNDNSEKQHQQDVHSDNTLNDEQGNDNVDTADSVSLQGCNPVSDITSPCKQVSCSNTIDIKQEEDMKLQDNITVKDINEKLTTTAVNGDKLDVKNTVSDSRDSFENIIVNLDSKVTGSSETIDSNPLNCEVESRTSSCPVSCEVSTTFTETASMKHNKIDSDKTSENIPDVSPAELDNENTSKITLTSGTDSAVKPTFSYEDTVDLVLDELLDSSTGRSGDGTESSSRCNTWKLFHDEEPKLSVAIVSCDIDDSELEHSQTADMDNGKLSQDRVSDISSNKQESETMMEMDDDRTDTTGNKISENSIASNNQQTKMKEDTEVKSNSSEAKSDDFIESSMDHPTETGQDICGVNQQPAEQNVSGCSQNDKRSNTESDENIPGSQDQDKKNSQSTSSQEQDQIITSNEKLNSAHGKNTLLSSVSSEEDVHKHGGSSGSLSKLHDCSTDSDHTNADSISNSSETSNSSENRHSSRQLFTLNSRNQKVFILRHHSDLDHSIVKSVDAECEHQHSLDSSSEPEASESINKRTVTEAEQEMDSQQRSNKTSTHLSHLLRKKPSKRGSRIQKDKLSRCSFEIPENEEVLYTEVKCFKMFNQ